MTKNMNYVYTLDNYDTISVTSLSQKDNLPFVLIGYPESNITVVYTKENEDLFPCWFFTENEIGFGKECVITKKQNGNIVIAVIAQNELDSSSTYFYECECKDGIYQWNDLKRSRKPVLNKNSTITNSISICNDDKNNILILVSGYTLLTDKGGVCLHYRNANQDGWEFVDLTALCGDDMNVGKSSSLLFVNDKYYLVMGNDKEVKIYNSKDIKNWSLVKTVCTEDLVDLSAQLDSEDNIILSVSTKSENTIYQLDIDNNNMITAFETKSEDEIVKSKLLINDDKPILYVQTKNNKVYSFGLGNDEKKELVTEENEFLMDVFTDYNERENVLSLSKTLRSDYLLVKDLQINDYSNKDLDNIDNEEKKKSVFATYHGNNESTVKNAKDRADMLKYLFDEYFDTLDSNTFSSYRCFFLKTLLNTKNIFFDTKSKKSKLYTSNGKNNKKNRYLNKYINIDSEQKNKMYESCILGYVTKDSINNIPQPYDTIGENNDKYICFMYEGENYFPNGKLEKTDEKDMEMIDLILESKVVTVTSLNYSTLKDLSLSSLIKVHFFTHQEDEEDETKFVKWKTLDGKVLEFPLMGIKDLFYNGLERNIKVKLQIASILEDFYFTIDSKCLNGDLVGQNTNELILYQLKTDNYLNVMETIMTEFPFSDMIPMGCCNNI